MRFKPPADLFVDGKLLLNALKVPKEDLVGLIPLYSGKCFDITFNSAESASRVATACVNVGGSQYPIMLLGVRSIDVSVFVSVEFPDELHLDTLTAYGELKSRTTRRCYFKDEGLRHLENSGSGHRICTPHLRYP